jgi:hypothetical protein
VVQVTVYAQAHGFALVHKAYDTHESSERAALKELLSTMSLEGKLIQADALHTTQAFFAGALSREPTETRSLARGLAVASVSHFPTR